ncbi:MULTISPECIES: SDR family oxidoreductase [Actinosynnema]|uniref:SDR family NAD(P)-dependent oxidoreductase n=1 Tax=Actinosynnema TaxID=40566 RepID=UPI0020A4A079|nr:SDR family NAD(P)-dependent oxidoreductase [Actinosynnema pretiosum]
MARALVIGNSDGIGLALSRRLLDDGWQVVGLSRRAAPLDHPAYAHHTRDVTDPGYPDVLAGIGRVDLCVYAAGVGDLLELPDLAPQTRALEVNLLGLARTAQAVLPEMLATGSGHLVGLSSLADALISPQAPGYAASKAGMISYLRGLAGAVRGTGVAVTCVRFGFVDTKMAKSPVKPALLSVDEAVELLLRCLRDRPTTLSRPRRMAAATTVLRLLAVLRR